MTTTPNSPSPDDENNSDSDSSIGDSESTSKDVPGAEIGISEGEGSTFEPEEDSEPHG